MLDFPFRVFSSVLDVLASPWVTEFSFIVREQKQTKECPM